MILKLFLLFLLPLSAYFGIDFLLNKFKPKRFKLLIRILVTFIVLVSSLSLLFQIDLLGNINLFLQSGYEALQFEFIRQALLVGSLVAFSSSFIGTFLVLKRYSMIGDGLAHVSFASVALALVLGFAPLALSIPLVGIASFLILKLNEKAELNGDAAIGLVSSFAVAVGVMIGSLAPGFNTDISTYLFGSILTITDLDVKLSLIISVLVLITILFFYHTFFSITFDEEFAKVNGTKTKMINYLLAALTSVTVVLGIRVVGTMLISSMIIFPTVSALQISKGFKQTIVISSFISILCVLFGIFTSYFLDLPPGATIVMFNGFIFIVLFLTKKII